MSTESKSPSQLVAELDPQAPRITDLLQRALEEDLGAGDLTTDTVLPDQVEAVGTFLAKESLVVAGLPIAQRVFDLLDPSLHFQALVEEGALVNRGRLAEVRGDARPLLRGERVALNFLQRLSGIASLTRRFVMRLEGTRTLIRDTRKTAPGLRLLEKYAVRVGGGANHRFGLYDGVLIKENHAQVAGSLGEAVKRAKARYQGERAVQAEVRDESELREALAAGADAILLDNMSVEQVDTAVQLVARRVPVEASGGIRLENVRAYAECGVDFISIGALTHSAPAADISLDLQPAKDSRA